MPWPSSSAARPTRPCEHRARTPTWARVVTRPQFMRSSRDHTGAVLGRYSNFFLASAGASAAFIGLLFVSLTIADTAERDERARTNRDALAGSAFAQLLDAFFVSIGGLADEVRIFAGLGVGMAILGLWTIS